MKKREYTTPLHYVRISLQDLIWLVLTMYKTDASITFNNKVVGQDSFPECTITTYIGEGEEEEERRFEELCKVLDAMGSQKDLDKEILSRNPEKVVDFCGVGSFTEDHNNNRKSCKKKWKKEIFKQLKKVGLLPTSIGYELFAKDKTTDPDVEACRISIDNSESKLSIELLHKFNIAYLLARGNKDNQ